jgi:predicted O-linked N-acetylglucosamine transferase (SPINDLY family)
MMICDWSDLESLRAAIDVDILADRASVQPFVYQAVATSAATMKLCATAYAHAEYPAQSPLIRDGTHFQHPKIRVGYLSGEFRNHITSLLMMGLFERHDRSRFEVFAFDAGWDDKSELRSRINKAFDIIVDISHLNDHQAAALISESEIDILVNLNGYFGNERTGIFSLRPAPLQVSYLGFSATMGATYIDYILADRYVIPPERRDCYTEKVIYLPDVYQVNDTQKFVANEFLTRKDFGIAEKDFVFCCFNNTFKITPEIFDVWMRLLSALNDSVLWLVESDAITATNLRREALRRGVQPSRIVFSTKAKEHSDYLARYKLADLFLDTYPFNAGATAADALWAGLPLLTCSSDAYAGRMAGSLLNAIGLSDLVTNSLEEYQLAAMKFARDATFRDSLRDKLKFGLRSSSLFNTEQRTRNIEDAYHAIYRRYQDGFAVEHIQI